MSADQSQTGRARCRLGGEEAIALDVRQRAQPAEQVDFESSGR